MSSYGSWEDGVWRWYIPFDIGEINIVGDVEAEAATLMMILSKIQPKLGCKDECIWLRNHGKDYSVQSYPREW